MTCLFAVLMLFLVLFESWILLDSRYVCLYALIAMLKCENIDWKSSGIFYRLFFWINGCQGFLKIMYLINWVSDRLSTDKPQLVELFVLKISKHSNGIKIRSKLIHVVQKKQKWREWYIRKKIRHFFVFL